jgi:type VI secretion system protein ImpK
MRLADCFTDMISYTLLLLNKKQGATISFDQAVSHIDRLVHDSEALFEKSGISREDYDLGKFAVFAWIDESIMRSTWEGRRQWQGHQLQRRFFQTADAGELFFQKLNMIGPHQNPVREVYYICLVLGFTGQYHRQGDEMLLDQLRISNLKLLTGSSMDLPDMSRITLFPKAYVKAQDSEDSAGSKRFSWITLAAFLAPAGFYGLLFLIYTFVLNNVGQTLITRMP